jgi:hypothetical protein
MMMMMVVVGLKDPITSSFMQIDDKDNERKEEKTRPIPREDKENRVSFYPSIHPSIHPNIHPSIHPNLMNSPVLDRASAQCLIQLHCQHRPPRCCNDIIKVIIYVWKGEWLHMCCECNRKKTSFECM